VTATLIDGQGAGRERARGGGRSVAELGHVGLATVLVGDDPASHIYIELSRRPRRAGMDARDLKLPGDTSEEDLLATIAELNSDDRRRRPARPAPAARPHRRDVRDRGDRACEGRRRHPSGERRPALPRPADARPGTPLGIMRMLDEYESRSRVRAPWSSGVPRSSASDGHLLLQRNATVTICHSRTQDLERHTLDADVLVAAVGART